ncbi:4-oxalocrotonate tautomerase [Paracoccus sp. S-4012]|uniref:tautomerase family protein n=1 Tax=Paracoccus sp. S-4012 TaxID=2665648 RepID=UPI0012B0C114|nr:tautomerase family protein [Paracoccus sp. S-4012]MRX51623.1 4-oxalocrotonate tautomerase [Paracoccus sp. S-4012]
MAIVQITLVRGRSPEQKAAIAAAINAAMVNIAGSPADHINIVFHEIERDNWAIAGQMLPDYVRNTGKG